MSTRKATPDIMGDVLAAKPESWNGKELDYPLEKIKVGSRLRPIDDAAVTTLADSIRQIGLLNPIHLLPDGTLVAGNHRRAAGKLLGWTHIRARIVELSEVDAELAEIDENLRRSNLTVLEEAEHLLRREELLEAKGARAKAGDNQHTVDDNGGGATVAPPATATTAGIAKGMGISERSAQVRLQIARNLDSQAKDAIRTTELASSTTQLVELARQPAEKQRTIADLIVRGEAGNVADAVRLIDPPPPPEPVKPTYWSPAPQAGGATVAPPPAEPHYAAVWVLESFVRDCVSIKSLTSLQLRQAVSGNNRSVLMMIEARIDGNYRRSDLNQAVNNVAAQMEAKAAGTNFPVGTDLDPWAVAVQTPGSRQQRAELLARVITPFIQAYRDAYGRNWQDLALNGNPAHTNSTFWGDIGKECKRRLVTVDDDTLKLAIKQAFSWLLADAPEKPQPGAAGSAAAAEIDKPLMEWTDEDWAKWQSASQAAVQVADAVFGITAVDEVDYPEWKDGDAAHQATAVPTYGDGNIVVPYLAQEWQEATKKLTPSPGDTDADIDAVLRPDAVPVSQRDDYDGDEWYTPAEYIAAARRVMGSIDLDPASCAMAQTVVQADVYLTKLENGLAQRWIRENVWLNPPYSNPAKWVEKLLREYDSSSPFTQQAVVLVNNATETEWFQSLLKRFPVCMLNKRIAFWRHDQSGITARQGQAIFYLGPNVSAFINEFETFGPILRRFE